MSSQRRNLRANMRRNEDDAPEQEAARVPMTQAGAQNEIFGKLAATEGRVTVKPFSIFSIVPDPQQPRRVLPGVIQTQWDRDPQHAPDVLRHWFQYRGLTEDQVREMVLAQGDAPEMSSYKDEDQFASLVVLAAEIYRDGLRQAISIYSIGNEMHKIEFGERRWWAHHLLALLFGEKWERIPAYVVPKPSIWAQASENNARSQLNAIERVRQLALLLMELISESEGIEFKSYEELVKPGQPDQVFYAQVADGETYRVPRGKGQQLLNATGLKSDSQLRQYRSLLRVPEHIWQQADDEDWAEGAIRNKMNDGKEKPTPKSHTVTVVTVSDDEQTEVDYDPNFSMEEESYRQWESDSNPPDDYDPTHDVFPVHTVDEFGDVQLGLAAAITPYPAGEAKQAIQDDEYWYRVRGKVEFALEQGWIDDAQAELNQYEELSNDPRDTRIKNLVTGEIVGGQQPRPVDTIPTPRFELDTWFLVNGRADHLIQRVWSIELNTWTYRMENQQAMFQERQVAAMHPLAAPTFFERETVRLPDGSRASIEERNYATHINDWYYTFNEGKLRISDKDLKAAQQKAAASNNGVSGSQKKFTPEQSALFTQIEHKVGSLRYNLRDLLAIQDIGILRDYDAARLEQLKGQLADAYSLLEKFVPHIEWMKGYIEQRAEAQKSKQE